MSSNKRSRNHSRNVAKVLVSVIRLINILIKYWHNDM